MDTTQKQDRAILRVSYLLLAMKGNVTAEEKRSFRKIAEKFSWFIPAKEEANSLLDDVVTSSQRLLNLKDFYKENEFMEAFIREVKNDCNTLKSSGLSARKAFAVWIATSLTDKNISQLEQSLLKALQIVFNGEICSNLQSPIFDSIVSVFGFSLMFSGNGYEEIISDDFLKSVEDDCRTLGDIQIQMESASSDEKRMLEKAYKVIEESLRERIIGDDAD